MSIISNINEDLIQKGFINEQSNSAIDGKSKQSAKDYLYKQLEPIIKGFFTDENWQPIHLVFRTLNKLNIDFAIDKSFYDNKTPHSSKTWLFTINFIDNKGKEQELNCHLKAYGSGSVKDPLDRYDITLLIN